jgi:putative aminopeptidase FrvX
MRKESLEFLTELVETPSPSGFEQPAMGVFRRYVQPYAASVQTDVMGNCTATLNPKGSPCVMLAGHCDQIGFIVNYITDKGFIHFRTIGGVDPTVAVSQRALISGDKGPVEGVVGRKAIHLMDPDDRKLVPKLHDLWIDIGAKSKADALKRIAIGDSGVFVQSFAELANKTAVSMAFDDKIGSYVVAETIRLLADRKIKACVKGVATVQEEVGLRGATTSAYSAEAQVGIAIDVGFAVDHPGVEKKKVGDLALHKGPMVCRGANINPVVFDMLVKTAKALKVPYQIEVAPGGTGTDANVMQLSRAGMATGLISVPLRYMHTPCEMLSIADVDNTCKLLAGFIERIAPKTDFTPL